LGETPERLLGLAEATVLANKGAVTAAARAAFEKMQKLAPDRPEPRFWLAHAREQDGDLKGAAAAYRTLLTAAPANAPWTAGVREQLADVERRLAGGAPDTTSRPAPPSRIARGPTAADVKAAETMTPADRMRMIEGMVDGLAARLKENGKDLEGWMKLVRAYKVLGRDPAALTAIADARKALAGDAKALGAIDELARSLGLGS
jgi:cytochrome c-type biogenesis protein CcmH